MHSLRALARKEKNSEEIKHNWGCERFVSSLMGLVVDQRSKSLKKLQYLA